MLVQEIMNKDVVAIDCKKTIYDACKLYKEKKFKPYSKEKLINLLIEIKKQIPQHLFRRIYCYAESYTRDNNNFVWRRSCRGRPMCLPFN